MTSVLRTVALLVLFHAFRGSEARSRALLQGQTLHAPRLFTMLTPISESSSLLIAYQANMPSCPFRALQQFYH